MPSRIVLHKLDAGSRQFRGRLSRRDRVVSLVSDLIRQSIYKPGEALPSCRSLGDELGVSRNTVFAAYTRLTELGLVISISRSGFFVSEDSVLEERDKEVAPKNKSQASSVLPVCPPDLPMEQARLVHPSNWKDYKFPFIYGQLDPASFPIEDWRECSRIVQGRGHLPEWNVDHNASDSPELIHQIQQRLHRYRGIEAAADEVLVTLGAQNALSILATLYSNDDRPIAIEEPGFQEGRHIFRLAGNKLTAVDVDNEGLVVDLLPEQCKAIYTTPGHHFPTMVTLSESRRKALLLEAKRRNAAIIEDDYEFELTTMSKSRYALKAMDDGQVIYVGSLSKTISPSIRIGFIVAHGEIIEQARLIRSLTVREPPSLIQDTTAHFMSTGRYDAHLRRMRNIYSHKWKIMKDAISHFMPEFEVAPSKGGTCLWIEGPHGFDSDALANEAKKNGVLIDRSSVFYEDNKPRSGFRLAFTTIPSDMIETGIKELSRVISMMNNKT